MCESGTVEKANQDSSTLIHSLQESSMLTEAD